MRKNEKKSIFSKPPQCPILSFWILNLHIILCQFKKNPQWYIFFVSLHVPATSGGVFSISSLPPTRLWLSLISAVEYLRARLKSEESICQLLSLKICDFQSLGRQTWKATQKEIDERWHRYLGIQRKPAIWMLVLVLSERKYWFQNTEVVKILIWKYWRKLFWCVNQFVRQALGRDDKLPFFSYLSLHLS